MSWIIGIVLIIIVGLYFLNKRDPATKNIASRYYALKDIFGNDNEISEKQYLEMSGVFSQIVYIQNGKLSIDDIISESENAVENEYGEKYSGETALIRFCVGINKLIYEINGLDPMDANMKVIKESNLYEKTVNKIKSKGYSKLAYSSINNYVMQFPGCLSGDYNGL
ncbi:hypothetical protein [Tenacibaculum ovolyticum]|uniref:hypothetical protein n=1 Tax=Tenacibaculum ovolyticum TaxID=104270 RepID=UPI003BAA5E9B